MKNFVAELKKVHADLLMRKQQAMIYQYDAKVIVAEYYGLSFEEVNLPFKEWMELRKKYEFETGKGL